MEKTNLKKQMMELWKENFHDSDEYIKLIFDAYFNPEYVEYEERDGRIIASLMAIPYAFGNNNYTINSVYLCGLSTYYKNRGEGIMTGLLHKIEEKLREKGYAFMFLIPSNSGIRRYYSDRGFINAFYKSALHYTSIHDFKKEYIATIQREEKALFDVKKRFYDNLKIVFYSKKDGEIPAEKLHDFVHFISECQAKQKGLAIYQTKKQIEIFLKENAISKGKIAVAYNTNEEISGIAIYDINETEFIEKGRFTINYASLCKIREKLVTTGDGRSLTIYQYGYEKVTAKALWNPFTSMVLPEANQVGAVGTFERVYNPNSHSEIYGMVRILSISEILKFQSNWRRDLKYSILVRQEKSGEIVEFTAKNGHIDKKIVSSEENGEKEVQLKSQENIYKRKMNISRGSDGYDKIVMGERDLGEILFRRPGTDRLVEEAFGIPALNGRISLLLD